MNDTHSDGHQQEGDDLMSDRPTSEILDVARVTPPGTGWWLILSCYHWYHWTGAEKPLVGSRCPCPSCSTITVIEGAP